MMGWGAHVKASRGGPFLSLLILTALLPACGTTGLTGTPDGGSDPVVEDLDVPEEPSVPEETWVAFIDMDDSRRYGTTATVTADGGIAFAGFKEGSVASLGRTVWIVKLTEHGQIEWSRYVGGAYWAEGIAEGGTGTLVVAGATNDEDIWLLETDREGNALRLRIIDTPDIGRALDIESLEDGGFAIVAQSGVTPWIARLDARLDIVWQRMIGGVLLDYRGAALDVARNGDLLVFCREATEDVAWLGRIDPEGSIIWQKDVTGDIFEFNGVGVAEMSNGDVAVALTATGGLCVLRFDRSGALLWQKVLGEERGYPITGGDDGRVLVAGCSQETDSYDMWMLGLDEGGDILWQKAVHIMREDSAQWMGRTPDGAVITISGGCCQTIVAKLTEQGTFYGHCENLVDTGALSSSGLFDVGEADATLRNSTFSYRDVEPETVDAPAAVSIFCRGSR